MRSLVGGRLAWVLVAVTWELPRLSRRMTLRLPRHGILFLLLRRPRVPIRPQHRLASLVRCRCAGFVGL